MRTTATRLLILGEGLAVRALAARLAAMPGVASVRQQATYTPGERLPDAHLCLEFIEGLSLAREAAMQTLAQGMGLVVGSPLLAATQGAMLAQAAAGQGVFFAIAAHGLGGAPALLQAWQATQATLLMPGAAQQALARCHARQEAPEQALRHLQARGADMSDAHGKRTHLLAHALLAAWQGVWPDIGQQPRYGLDDLDPSWLPMVHSLGLKLAYGASITSTQIRTGLLALPAQHSWQGAQPQVLAHTLAGMLTLEAPATGGDAAAAVLAIQAFLAGQKRAVLSAGMVQPHTVAPTYWLMLGRGAVPTVAAEQTQRHTAAGWARVVAIQGPQVWPEGTLAVPLVQPWQEAAVAMPLRLVG